MAMMAPSRVVGLSDYSDVPTIKDAVGTFIGLYSGAGGLDVGFALAGFVPVWVNDINEQAMETHERIFKRLRDERPHLAQHSWNAHAGDMVAALKEGLIPGRGAADLVIGGPPCQGFSVAGKMDPTDERSQHVMHFLDVVERVEPKAFVIENVKALYSSRRWEGIRQLLRGRAKDLGYTCEMWLLNAAHYGVPQARERMVFVGIRDGRPVMPLETSAHEPPTVRMALRQLPPAGRPGNDSFCSAKITTARQPVLRRSPYAGMMFNGAGRPLDLDLPCLTVPASMGGNRTPIIDQALIDDPEAQSWVVEYHARLWNGEAPLQRVPASLRRLTVEEASAMQTFPLGTDWAGPQSSQFRQIGNAVPPRLGYAVANALKEAIEF